MPTLSKGATKAPAKSTLQTTVKHEAADGTFMLPPLPFAEDALEPVISRKTLALHHGKHHKSYVEKLNKLVKNTSLSGRKLEDVILAAVDDPAKKKIFSNAAQVWNHTFYWHSLSPSQVAPSKTLVAAIDRDFGGLDEMKAMLAKKAVAHFASGWAWLTLEDEKLVVVDTHDADTPFAHGATCLLCIDVWEHAYYLDYQNDRESHVRAVLDKLLNWEFASANFER